MARVPRPSSFYHNSLSSPPSPAAPEGCLRALRGRFVPAVFSSPRGIPAVPCSPPAEPFPFFPRSLEPFPQTLSVICTSLQKQGAQNKMQCSRWNLTIALNNQVTTSHRLLPAPPPPHGSAVPRLHRIPGSIPPPAPPRALSIPSMQRSRAIVGHRRSSHVTCRVPALSPRCWNLPEVFEAAGRRRCRSWVGFSLSGTALEGLVRCVPWGAGNAGVRHSRVFPALHTISSRGLG